MKIKSVDDARFELELAFKKHRRWDHVSNNFRAIAGNCVDNDPLALKRWFDGDPDNEKYFQQAVDEVLADTLFLIQKAQAWRIMELMAEALEQIVAEADEARIDEAQAELPDNYAERLLP